MSDIPITIIGGGVIGNAVAYALTKKGKEAVLIEKNDRIPGDNQSARNSGVLHAGIYYTANGKRVFCKDGNEMTYDFARQFGVPHRQTGKLVVAPTFHQMGYLTHTFNLARANDVPVEVVQNIADFDPSINGYTALHFPTSGIIDGPALVSTLSQLSTSVHKLTSTIVTQITPIDDGFKIATQSGDYTEIFTTDRVINAAGLYAVEIAKMVNPDLPYTLAPSKGESAKFYATGDLEFAGMNVYQAPYGVYPDGTILDAPFEKFLELYKKGEVKMTVGVHLTPTIGFEEDRTVTVGPLTTPVNGFNDYSHSASLDDIATALHGIHPVTASDLSYHNVGIHANLIETNDFAISRDSNHHNLINILGANSPGLTSGIAIGQYVADMD